MITDRSKPDVHEVRKYGRTGEQRMRILFRSSSLPIFAGKCSIREHEGTRMKDIAQTTMAEPVVQAESLRKTFGAFTAVDGISFHVRRGECYGILGPNGAGKTSTIRMIYGFSPLSGGSLRVLGQDVTKRRQLRKAKYRIGVC
jgi:ABC-type glutathione transport system ATPase component